MKKIFLVVVVIIILVYLASTVDSDKKDGSEEVEETQSVDNGVDKKTSKKYSDDPAANKVIASYNEQNPDDPITEDMVELPDNGGVYYTVIHFEYCDFIVSEADGDPSYKCRSILDITEENTIGFYNEAYKVLHAVEMQLTAEEIKEVLDTLINPLLNGENSVDKYIKIPNSKRGISFSAPTGDWVTVGDKKVKVTYILRWFETGIY